MAIDIQMVRFERKAPVEHIAKISMSGNNLSANGLSSGDRGPGLPTPPPTELVMPTSIAWTD
jgi:hypothetical protein